MSPEDDAQLRHLLRKGKQLPMPTSHLLGSVSRRWSRFAELPPTLKRQSEIQQTKILEEAYQKKKKKK